MGSVQVVSMDGFGRGFIPPEYLPAGKDEYYLRNEQLPFDAKWRRLHAHEIETLVKMGNTCDDWNLFLVADPFDAGRIKNSHFVGMVRIARLENVVLEHHDLQTPAGITNSLVISCDVGANAAIHNVRHMAHYIIGQNVLLLNIGELHVSNHAKFGNGILKDGEDESIRIWMNPINEAGGRGIMPFDGMTCGDAYLWARYRDRGRLMDRFAQITQKQFDSRRGYYGLIGDGCVLKNCQIIKDVRIGPACYIKGANKLKNLTINSSAQEPSQIGEGVELVNGIIGFGCHIFYGCKAVRFVMGNNSNLKYGARLIHSFLGDNSTVSCCELLHNLIFPAHEQHHNNSFLTASLVLGQSNLAAGATIGSNHNSRANDGEIIAGRGFWPGLCTTLKHYCRFASFVLLAKGDYPSEMDIPLPFSLLSNDTSRDRLVVLPAFWWMYNMYALARNTWKFAMRDTRITKVQQFEFDSLAPDTVEEIFNAMSLLEKWTAKAKLTNDGCDLEEQTDDQLRKLGRELLMSPPEATAELTVLGEDMEDSNRPVVILKHRAAYHAYRQMLHYYSVKNLMQYMRDHPAATLDNMVADLAGPRLRHWVNVGGQLVCENDVESLLDDVEANKLASWTDIHARYQSLDSDYPRQKQAHALATLLDLLGLRAAQFGATEWRNALDECVKIQDFICEQVHATRQKDYADRFRQMTFRNKEEMEAVVGSIEANSFVKQIRSETQEFARLVAEIKKGARSAARHHRHDTGASAPPA
ncbi:MAG: DUF4954 family protein [Planctomycetes bacterium]|nr:DUF4954 family protein [Planctomycetota bacterium]